MHITDQGVTTLGEGLDAIDNEYLRRFPGFVIFNRGISPDIDEDVPCTLLTTEEEIERNYQVMRDDLSRELLELVRNSPPSFFEILVVDLLVSMGYGGSVQDAGEAVGRSNDEGIDGIIKEDTLGMDVSYIQAKRWNSSVGRQEIQAFVGSLEGKRARNGVFITTSQFTRTAEEYIQTIEKKVVLIDGKRLAGLMIDHGIGVTDLTTYTIKRVDTDYFAD